MFYYYMDPTYILVLIGVVICMAASSKMKPYISSIPECTVTME